MGAFDGLGVVPFVRFYSEPCPIREVPEVEVEVEVSEQELKQEQEEMRKREQVKLREIIAKAYRAKARGTEKLPVDHELVETGYKEGWETGRNGGTSFPMFEQDWKNSRTLAKLKSEENGDELQNIVNLTLTERVKTLECLLNRVWINQAGSNLPAGLIVDIGKALGLNIGQDDFRD